MLLFILTVALIANTRENFNTSHVTVYRVVLRYLSGNLTFQYISCYCLSCSLQYFSKILFIFQYISCYCLSWECTTKFSTAEKFQYISCYCLSLTQNLKLTNLWHFNTSHVTVYLFENFFNFGLSIFQYISCYCLSLFAFGDCNFSCISIHLMLLFISWMPLSYHQIFYFNTSHVTVYPGLKIPHHHRCSISIHLMLLFISDMHKNIMDMIVFQYISCYCLSRENDSSSNGRSDFNTSHVTVYQYFELRAGA